MSDDGWHRLSPLSPFAGLGRVGVAIVVLALPSFAHGSGDGVANIAVFVSVAVVGIVASAISWRVTRWRIAEGALQKESGLLRRQSLRFPLPQIQAVDVVQPAFARVLGLAELRLHMGGSTNATGRLAYLRREDALALRTRLLAHEQATEKASDVLFAVSTARLLASIALDFWTFVSVIVAAVVVAFVGVAGAWIWLLPAVAQVWRRLNGELRVRVTDTGDALHVEGGALATSAETIPRGRVQAVKLVEPLLWRPFGWCRLQVALAGREGRDSNDTSGVSTRAGRTLVPVGTRAQADVLLRRLLPELPAGRRRPPRRAWLKSPLRYHHLAWARTDTVVVTVGGRTARVTAWVPLEKVQSLRRVRGPLQRALRLETVHLDTAGRGVHAALRDRDVDEGDRALSELVALSRARRAGA